MQNNLADHLLKRDEEMQTDRHNFENVWQEISEFVTPNRGDFIYKRATAQRLDERVYDSTAVHSNEMLASALHSGLTNPSSKWFTLNPVNAELRDSRDVMENIETRLRYMYAIVNSPNTKFYQHNHEFLLDIGAYGTACMFIDEDEKYKVRFKNLHLSEIKFQENHLGEIDTVHRNFKMTARQAFAMFEESGELPDKLKRAAEDSPDKKFDFLHVVMPMTEYENVDGFKEVAGNKEFASIYVCCESKQTVSTGGYYEMPYIIARWEKLVGEVYGRSPAWNALSDIRMVNTMSETIIRAAQKQVDPPLLMADDGVIMPLHTHPSGVNIGGLTEDGTPLVAPLVTGGNIQIGEIMLEQRREAIRKAFFVDQFAPSAGTPASATERVQIEQTGLRLTGPHLNRLQIEYLTPVIDRVHNILQRAGVFPIPPEELDSEQLNVEYVSPLASNQRQQELQALNRAIQSIQVLLEAGEHPLFDNIDKDGAFRDALDIAAFPKSQVVNKDDVDRTRKARQQAQQQQAQQQQAMQAADTAANLQRSGIPVA